MTFFGWNGVGASHGSTEDRVHAGKFTCPVSCTADSITVYLLNDTVVKNARCILYDAALSPVVNGETEQKAVPIATDWLTFNFVAPKPVLTVGVYWICVFGDAGDGFFHAYYEDSQSGFDLRIDDETYDGIPDPLAGTEYADFKMSIYCNYTKLSTGRKRCSSLMRGW